MTKRKPTRLALRKETLQALEEKLLAAQVHGARTVSWCTLEESGAYCYVGA